MNANKLIDVALKVWGVILFIGALTSFPVAFLMARVRAGTNSQAAFLHASEVGAVLNLVLQAAAGIVVVVWSDRIANLIESDTSPLRIDADAHALQVLGFALVGVVLLVQGLENAAVTGYVWHSTSAFSQEEALSFVWQRQADAIIKAIVEIAAGVALVFGRDTIVARLSRAPKMRAGG